MSNFENILQFLHFSIALDMSRITHFLAEIMNLKKSASGHFLTFSMSVLILPIPITIFVKIRRKSSKVSILLFGKWCSKTLSDCHDQIGIDRAL